jgi:hypothetical protein
MKLPSKSAAVATGLVIVATILAGCSLVPFKAQVKRAADQADKENKPIIIEDNSSTETTDLPETVTKPTKEKAAIKNLEEAAKEASKQAIINALGQKAANFSPEQRKQLEQALEKLNTQK